MTVRRIVRHARSPGVLGDLLSDLGLDGEDALREGRVFVGRKRARSMQDPLAHGDEVVVHPPVEKTQGARVLAIADDVAALYKPAGMPTIADHRGTAGCLADEAARLLGPREAAELHPTSRLDTGVSGVVLFALTKGASKRLLVARAEGDYLRHYVALAVRAPATREGSWAWAIGRARDPRKRMVDGRDATPAETRYATIQVAPNGVALLSVFPRTGRTHQIRVHAAFANAPLLGDTAYGGPSRLTSPNGAVTAILRVGLHAARVDVPGLYGDRLSVTAPVPDDLSVLWEAAGGAPSAWVDALARAG